MSSTKSTTSSAPSALHQLLQRILVDPQSHRAVELSEQGLRSGDQSFELIDGIPMMLLRTESQAHHQEHYRIDAEEFDYFEERDPATEHDEERLRQSIEREIAPSAQSVLDVGCGRAWVAQKLCPSNINVCSLDISITNPRKALEKFPYASHCAVVADAMALPFADQSFDCVIASEIIEHLPDPAGFVRELLRVLKAGGRLIVSTPYKERLRYVLCIHCNQRTPIHAHIQSFDEQVLRNLVPDTAAWVRWHVFGNKALLMMRTYVFLRWMPYAFWHMIDRMASAIVPRDSHIVVVWNKPS